MLWLQNSKQEFTLSPKQMIDVLVWDIILLPSHTYYSDVIIGAIASQVTNLTTVCSTVYSGADKRQHQSSASLAFVWGIQQWPVNSMNKGPVMRKMFPIDDVIIFLSDGRDQSKVCYFEVHFALVAMLPANQCIFGAFLILLTDIWTYRFSAMFSGHQISFQYI